VSAPATAGDVLSTLRFPYRRRYDTRVVDSRATAIILYLYVGQFFSKQRTAQVLSELSGTPVSQGSVSAMTRRT
jgi:hypothetical protein